MTQTNRLARPKQPARRRLVLIVDDSRAQRRMLAVQLVRAGFDVAEVDSGEAALEFFATAQPDFVLSAWVMPGMSGLDLCRRFRALPRDHYGYFVLLTSKTDKHDIAMGLESGADDFLTKPISGVELVGRLTAGERILAMEDRLRAGNRALEDTLRQLRQTQDLMERDLREARKLQQGLVREKNRRFGDFEVSVLMRPAGHVGGDLIGFFPINARRVGLFSIDVSGHGVTAALLTARLAGYLSGTTDQNIALHMTDLGLYDARPPAALAQLLNHLMLEDMRTDSYLTMCYADLDFVSGELVLVQAGHPHPIIQRADSTLESIGNGGLPIGVLEDAEYEQVHARLNPGDRLFIASDGIIEACNPAGKLLGEDGLQAIMRTNAPLTGTSFLESLSWSVSNFAAGRRDDDISAILVEYRPLPADSAG